MVRFSFGDRKEGEARLRELMLYVAHRYDVYAPEQFDKLLWWCDFLAFAKHGEPITGVEYRSLWCGPAPLHSLSIREEMVSNGDARISRSWGYHFTALRKPNLDMFTAEQFALVDSVISDLQENADKTHISWEVAGLGNSIPYETIFLFDGPVTPSDVARTKELVSDKRLPPE